MNIAGLRFGHVAFKVADPDRSIRWYGDAFGARLIHRSQAQGERPELMFLEFAPGQCVEFFTNGRRKPAPSPEDIGYMHFCLLVDDLDAALKHLAGMEVRPDRGPFLGRAKQRIAFISDPDGNVIELMQILPESPLYRE